MHVLDNQSSDNTMPWLKSLSDDRIRLWTSGSALSIEDSWARVKGVEKREFMTLIGHDDILHPGFLAAIKTLIDRHPDAALYQTGSHLINADGKRIRNCRPASVCETAAQYLAARFTFQRDVFGTGYVMRSADYDRVGGIPAFERLFFADDVLWLSLMRGSYKAYDPGDHFAVRIHPKSESASLPSAWGSILRGLYQFSTFLRGYTEDDEASRVVAEMHGPAFMLAYHRNAYILALVESSQAGRKISSDATTTIRASLAACAPGLEGDLGRSAKIVLIHALNAGPMRALVPWLWNAYCRFKNSAR
jgi:hypothetical protein